MNVMFSKNALRNLEKLEKATQKRIVDKTEFYFSQKNPLAQAEKMKDTRFGQWRLRIEITVFYSMLKTIVLLFLKLGTEEKYINRIKRGVFY